MRQLSSSCDFNEKYISRSFSPKEFFKEKLTFL
jgi:hypothetical protein